MSYNMEQLIHSCLNVMFIYSKKERKICRSVSDISDFFYRQAYLSGDLFPALRFLM